MSSTVILSVGQDSTLLETRSLILRAAGYIVQQALSLQQAVNQFSSGDFDLVILCHSMPTKDRDHMACWIRASGSLTPVISISQNPGQRDDFADATIESAPIKLLRVIKKVSTKVARISAAETAMPDGRADGKDADGKAWRKTILSIDDDPNLLVVQRRLLENAGYLVLTMLGGSDGLKVFSTGIVDTVILDYAMPLMNGGAVAVRMRKIKKDVPLILLSGCSTIPEEDFALFDRFIPKGGSPIVLLSAIDELLSAAAQKKSAQSSESGDTHYASHALL